MNIAFVTHKFGKGDGQGRVNYEVVWEALRQGHHVTLLAGEVAEDLQAHPRVTTILFPVAHYPSALLQNHFFALRTSQWLKTHRAELDFIQVNGAITFGPTDLNAVHFVHSAWLRSPVHTARLQRSLAGLYQWLYTSWNARLERKAFADARCVVAVSDQVRCDLLEIGVPDRKIRVILNGVDLDEFHPGPASRHELGVPEGVPLAFFAGDIRTPRKNLDTVLHALVDVPGVHLIVAGTVEGSPYPALSSRLGLAERVHFLGFRRDIAHLMRAADLFAFPSRYETCGLVILEALASGLPVITARTAGGANVVTPGCGVVLPDPNDTAALTAAFHLILADTEHRLRMGLAARSEAEKYSWNRMACEYLAVAEQLGPVNAS